MLHHGHSRASKHQLHHVFGYYSVFQMLVLGALLMGCDRSPTRKGDDSVIMTPKVNQRPRAQQTAQSAYTQPHTTNISYSFLLGVTSPPPSTSRFIFHEFQKRQGWQPGIFRKTTAYQRHHDCPGHQFAPISFETQGRISPGAMQFLGTVAHGAFLAPLRAALAAAALTIYMYKRLSVINCRYKSRLITAAAGLQTANTGRGWIRVACQPCPD